MSAKPGRTTLNLAGAATPAVVGLLLADPPRARRGDRANSKSTASAAGQGGQGQPTRSARAPAELVPQSGQTAPEMEQTTPMEILDQLSQLEAAFGALTESVLIFDHEGHILRANAADRALLGYGSRSTRFTTSLRERERQLVTRDERGQPFAANQSPYARILRGEAIGVEYTVEAIVRTSAGRDIQVGMSGTPLMSAAGAVIGGIVVTRDVTEQRRREVGLRDANRGMREFLAVAAHDLRTPITASKGYIQLAVRRLNNLAALATTEAPSVVGSIAQVRKNLEDAEQNSQRLARLVDRLLDAAQIQANKLEMQAETVDLAAIVYTKVREQRLATPGRAIRYKVRPMRAVPTLVDPERIGEVLLNYLANALKYSPEDSVVEVTFGVRDGVARISVRDMGLGIPPADQQRIWSRFEQLEGAQHHGSAVGLGLGLYISRAIVEAHGGLVGVESEVGCGSTFWFEVPLDHQTD